MALPLVRPENQMNAKLLRVLGLSLATLGGLSACSSQPMAGSKTGDCCGGADCSKPKKMMVAKANCPPCPECPDTNPDCPPCPECP